MAERDIPQPLTVGPFVDEMAEQFEVAWRAGNDPDIVSFIPAASPHRRELLVELIQVEWELRLKAGESIWIEDYQSRFAEFADDAPLWQSLRNVQQRLTERADKSESASENANIRLRHEDLHVPKRAGWPGKSEAYNIGQDDQNRELVEFLSPAQADDEMGRLGPYRVLEILGAGGMGVVFRAEDPHLKRIVVLKTMRPGLATSHSAKIRFVHEAQAVARITHDHIVKIYHVGEVRGTPYLVMEYLQGESLNDQIKRDGTLPVKETLRIGREIAEGLQAAHDELLIHRDIKPANIWLEKKKGRVKILDFGLARAVDDSATLTQTGLIIGTAAYMSPEQAAGEKVDLRCDLFSLGCVLYQSITGKRPFTGTNTISTLYAVATTSPEAPIKQDDSIPLAVSDLIMRLLSKDRDKRPGSAREVADAIEAIELQLDFRTTDSASSFSKISAGQTQIAAAWKRRPTKEMTSRYRAIGAAFCSAIVLAGVLVWVMATNRKSAVKVDQSDTQMPTVQLESPDFEPVVKLARAPMAFESPGFEDWVHSVTKMPAEKQLEAVSKKLVELNPRFDGSLEWADWKGPPVIENGVVVRLLVDSEHVSDLSPVRALTGLKELRCQGRGNVLGGDLSDLSPLKGMKLISLDISFSPFIHDLSPLEGMQLEELRCSQTSVSDLTPLKQMPISLLAIETTRVSNLTPLHGINLREVHLSPWSVKKGMDLIRQMNSLSTIGITSERKWTPEEFWKRFDAGEFGKPATAYRDPEFLDWVVAVQKMRAHRQVGTVTRKLQELNPGFDGVLKRHLIQDGVVTELEFSTDHISDISPVRALNRLRVLRCPGTVSGTEVHGQLSDLSPLNGMELKSLSCGNSICLCDLSPLKGIPLSELDCSATSVFDLSPLKGMKLTFLNCYSMQIVDLSPLKRMPLRTLNCSNTWVFDLSPIQGIPLELLDVHHTRVSDLTHLQGMGLKFIAFQPDKITTGLNVIRQMKSLEKIYCGSSGLYPIEFWQKYDSGGFGKP